METPVVCVFMWLLFFFITSKLYITQREQYLLSNHNLFLPSLNNNDNNFHFYSNLIISLASESNIDFVAVIDMV